MTNLPAGTQVFIGPPSNPLPEELVLEIAHALSEIAGIREAHLPMIYSKGMIDPPAQVLIIVLENGSPSQIPQIAEAVRRILPKGQYLDVMHWPADHPAMPTVRQTGCVVNMNRKPN
jgi:hypothetical protein